MDTVSLSFILLLILLFALAGGLWIALSLGLIGFVGMIVASGVAPYQVMSTAMWQSLTSWDLTALPMFVLMGEILYRTRLSRDLFDGLAPWVQHLPGRLLHVSVFGSTVFAAVSGSSAATCATIGRIVLPELKQRGYDTSRAVGTLAGSGTIGLMIPPSIILIVYATATEQSVARLFIAGVLPGLMVAALFSGFLVVWALLNPRLMPPADPPLPWSQRISATLRLLPVMGLILGVIGSIYAGLASATEAAAVGVLLSLALSAAQKSLSWRGFREALFSATRTSCMICFILAGAAFLTAAMGYTGIPRNLAQWISGFDLANWQLLMALTLFFVVMGCFLDGISMVVLTTSIVVPMVTAAGFDLIWFGIFIVLVVEMAQITPPVGFNLYVLQALTGRNILRVGLDALPLFMLLLVAVVLLALFPQIALWLPETMLDV